MMLEHVTFVEFDPSLDKQFPVFLDERRSAVMLFLSLDVFDEALKVALGAGECRVSILPVREVFEDRVALNPEGGARFDVFHKIRQAHRGVQAGEDVYVVLYTVDSVKMTATIVDDAPNIAKQVFPAVALENRLPVFGRKHDVVMDGGMG